MLLNYTPYFSILFLTAIVSAVVGLATLGRHPKSPGRNPFILMMFAIAAYAMVAAMEAAAVQLSDKLFWSTLEYIGSGSSTTLFLIFILYFTQKQHWLSPKITAILWLIPTINVILVSTNAWHYLVWSGFELGPLGSNLIIYKHGPGFFWIMACIYTYATTGVLLLLKASFHASSLYRQQARLALLGAIFPLLGGIAYIFKLVPPGLNLPPMCFMLTGLLYIANLSRFRLFDLAPIARDILIETMLDGVLVLDREQRIVDINPAAEKTLNLTKKSIGKAAYTILLQWPELLNTLEIDSANLITVQLHRSSPCYIDLQSIQLRDRQGRRSGTLIVLRDVTTRHLMELKLRQVNQQLQQKLVEIEALQAQLKEQTIRDSLTGLFNRRYFEETLPRELALAERQGYPVTLILMDIDHFKQINDTYGHPSGDRVLQAFADLLRHSNRSSDIACRYGGEEFVLPISGMNSTQALQRAEQIRLFFEASWVEVDGKKIYSTFSAGVSVFPEDGTSLEKLMRAADQALYAAKARGRNCTCLAKQTDEDV